MPALNAAHSTTPAGEPSDKPLFPAGHLVPFVLVTALFFLWGVPNNLNDVLIRQFMKSFAITRLQAGLVQSAFYLGYFFLAIPAALLMRKLGYKAGFVIGLLLFAVGTGLFWPAALVGQNKPVPTANKRSPITNPALYPSLRISKAAGMARKK